VFVYPFSTKDRPNEATTTLVLRAFILFLDCIYQETILYAFLRLSTPYILCGKLPWLHVFEICGIRALTGLRFDLPSACSNIVL
jgi:hypothetical protein